MLPSNESDQVERRRWQDPVTTVQASYQREYQFDQLPEGHYQDRKFDLDAHTMQKTGMLLRNPYSPQMLINKTGPALKGPNTLNGFGISDMEIIRKEFKLKLFC